MRQCSLVATVAVRKDLPLTLSYLLDLTVLLQVLETALDSFLLLQLIQPLVDFLAGHTIHYMQRQTFLLLAFSTVEHDI
jgi:hypothetical protein